MRRTRSTIPAMAMHPRPSSATGQARGRPDTASRQDAGSSWPRVGHAMALLKHGDHGERRFCALVTAASGTGEAVAATAGPFVEQRHLGVVVAEKPCDAHLHAREPLVIAGNRPRAVASVVRLSEAGRFSPGPHPSGDITDRWPSLVSIASSHLSIRSPLRSIR